MKKLSLFAVAALFAVGFTACKKEYTCTCTTTEATNNTTTSTIIDLGKLSKKDADTQCDARVTSVSGFTTTCAVD